MLVQDFVLVVVEFVQVYIVAGELHVDISRWLLCWWWWWIENSTRAERWPEEKEEKNLMGHLLLPNYWGLFLMIFDIRFFFIQS